MKQAVIVTALALLLLAGCKSLPGNRFCQSDSVLIEQNFEGGQFAHCEVNRDGHFTIEIRPEDKPPINVSPWYAMRLTATEATETTLTLHFTDGYARYWPKTSTDGKTWRRLDDAQVTIADDGESMRIRLPLTTTSTLLSAQELLTADWYDDWLQELRANAALDLRLLGASRAGRPIFHATTNHSGDYLLLLGRQHPPEVSGAVAMRPFVATVLGDSALAQRFRQRFGLVIVPLMNPDGVAAGHWRHNLGGTDLNRDWGPFTQPETQSVQALLARLESRGRAPVLMLDFHSTRRNVFYTQVPEDFPPGEDFAGDWLAAAQARLPEFEFSRQANPPSEQANAKNYFYKRFAIPSITYELGDETDRDAARRAAVVFAEEMMRMLLEEL